MLMESLVHVVGTEWEPIIFNSLQKCNNNPVALSDRARRTVKQLIETNNLETATKLVLMSEEEKPSNNLETATKLVLMSEEE